MDEQEQNELMAKALMEIILDAQKWEKDKRINPPYWNLYDAARAVLKKTGHYSYKNYYATEADFSIGE